MINTSDIQKENRKSLNKYDWEAKSDEGCDEYQVPYKKVLNQAF